MLTSVSEDGQQMEEFPFDIDEFSCLEVAAFEPIKLFYQDSLECYSMRLDKLFLLRGDDIDYTALKEFEKMDIFISVSMLLDFLAIGQNWDNIVARTLESIIPEDSFLHFPAGITVSKEAIIATEYFDNNLVEDEMEQETVVVPHAAYVSKLFLSSRLKFVSSTNFIYDDFENFMINGIGTKSLGLSINAATGMKGRKDFGLSCAADAIKDLYHVAGIFGRKIHKAREEEDDIGNLDNFFESAHNTVRSRSLFQPIDYVGIGYLGKFDRFCLLKRICQIIDLLDRLHWVCNKIYGNKNLSLDKRKSYDIKDFPTSMEQIVEHNKKYPWLKSYFSKTSRNIDKIGNIDKSGCTIDSEGTLIILLILIA